MSVVLPIVPSTTRLLATMMLVLVQTPTTAAPDAAVVDDTAMERPARAAARLSIAKGPYPAVVQQAVDAGKHVCREAGGESFVARPGLVRSGDLSGDGRIDYVVDFREALCAERVTLFSGTGGWNLEIFVARPAGEPNGVFSGRVLDYELVKQRGQQMMHFRVHGSYCGRSGTDPCFKQRRLTTQAFAFHDR